MKDIVTDSLDKIVENLRYELELERRNRNAHAEALAKTHNRIADLVEEIAQYDAAIIQLMFLE